MVQEWAKLPKRNAGIDNQKASFSTVSATFGLQKNCGDMIQLYKLAHGMDDTNRGHNLKILNNQELIKIFAFTPFLIVQADPPIFSIC